jgi:hypothetical protein
MRLIFRDNFSVLRLMSLVGLAYFINALILSSFSFADSKVETQKVNPPPVSRSALPVTLNFGASIKSLVHSSSELSADLLSQLGPDPGNSGTIGCQFCRLGKPVSHSEVKIAAEVFRIAEKVKEEGGLHYKYDEFKSLYEASSQSKCFDYHMGRVARLGVGRDLCFRAVKIGMQIAGRTGEGAYLEGNSASMAVSILASDEQTKGRAHVNLLDHYPNEVTTSNAPLGSILVFTGPWVALSGPDDEKAKSLKACPTKRRRRHWPNDCVFSEYGRWYIYRNYKIDEEGKPRKCEGLGTQHGHIEVRTKRGYAHFVETKAPIDEYMPGCRILVGIMADPKVLDKSYDQKCRGLK